MLTEEKRIELNDAFEIDMIELRNKIEAFDKKYMKDYKNLSEKAQDVLGTLERATQNECWQAESEGGSHYDSYYSSLC